MVTRRRDEAGGAGLAELVLVRHGESVGNLAAQAASDKGVGRLDLPYRDPDTPLSPTGAEQARELGRLVAGLVGDRQPDAVMASPYVRAASTMTHALEEWSDSPTPLLDERLRERDLGLFDGMTGQGIRDAYPEEAGRRAAMGKFYYRPPGGESWTDVVLRIRSFLGDLRAEHEGECVWVFTHQAVIMSFRYLLEALSEEDLLRIDGEAPLGNCSLTVYRRAEGGGMALATYGSVEHLESSPAQTTREASHAPTDPEDRLEGADRG